MKQKENIVLRTIVGQKLLSMEGAQSVNMSKIITLNDTAAYLWESVTGNDFTEEDLTNLLLDRYDVDEERASKDVKAITETWKEMGLIED